MSEEICPICKTRPQYSESGLCDLCGDKAYILHIVKAIRSCSHEKFASHILRIFQSNAFISGATCQKYGYSREINGMLFDPESTRFTPFPRKVHIMTEELSIPAETPVGCAIPSAPIPEPTTEELLASTNLKLEQLQEFVFKLQDMYGNCVRHMIHVGTDKHLTKSVKDWFAGYEPTYQAQNADLEKAEVIKAFEAKQKQELADLKYQLFGKKP